MTANLKAIVDSIGFELEEDVHPSGRRGWVKVYREPHTDFNGDKYSRQWATDDEILLWHVLLLGRRA